MKLYMEDRVSLIPKNRGCKLLSHWSNMVWPWRVGWFKVKLSKLFPLSNLLVTLVFKL